MTYPIDYDSFMQETKENGIEPDDDVKNFMNTLIIAINNAYYQGRLDESLNRE